MYNPYSLAGKTILITGASSGIGRATAIECSKLGAKCIITGRNQERLQATFGGLEGEGHVQMTADLSQQADIKALVEAVPSLDGLVNVAGIAFGKPIGFLKQEDMATVFGINAFAPMMLTNDLLKKRKLCRNASVVFVSSTASYTAITGNSVYGGAKAALTNFMHHCTCEYTPVLKIRFNAVSPGIVETEMIKNLGCNDEQIADGVKPYPLRRYGKPTDIALGIIYLLSDASSWVAGSNLIIDGGLFNAL